MGGLEALGSFALDQRCGDGREGVGVDNGTGVAELVGLFSNFLRGFEFFHFRVFLSEKGGERNSNLLSLSPSSLLRNTN